MTAFTARSFTLPLLAGLGVLLALLAPGSADASICSGFYSANFALQQGKLNPPMLAMAKPAKGARFTEKNFKTCVVRATAHDVEPPTHFARNDYSRRQAFNANNTYFLIYSDGGVWNLYDANTLQYIRALTPLAGDAEAQWHPTDPNTLYYLPTNGGTKLMKVDVRTNASSVAVDFQGKLPSWAASATHLWTHSEGSPSADGRYWGFIAYNNSWKVLGYIVWDLQQNKLVGSRQDSPSDLDNASISALGHWFVTTGDKVWAWSPDFTKKKKLADLGGVHTDMGIGANGHDVFVSVDFQSNGGDIYYIDLDSCPSVIASATTAPLCPRTVLFSMYTDGGWATPHFSMKAFNKPGWLLLSMYDAASNTGTLPWFTNKVMAVELKASPKIYPLAYTHRVAVTSGDTDGAGNYWSEPHGSVNRDFTRIIFNSNWGNSVGADVDAYILELPANALGGTGGPVRVPTTGGNLPPSQGSGTSSNSVAAASTPALSTGATGSGSTGSAVFSLGCRVCNRLARAGASWRTYSSDMIPRTTRPALSLAAGAGNSMFIALPVMAVRALADLVAATVTHPAQRTITGAGKTRTTPAMVSLAASPTSAGTCLSGRGVLPIVADFREPMAYHQCLMERGSR